MSWDNMLKAENKKMYFMELMEFINEEYSLNKIYPDKKNIFKALEFTPLSNVKVVILGQDPYHGENQANGLSFSVNKEVKVPPSLVNIFKELNNDLSIEIPLHGSLENWAKEGVLLLNTVLTVKSGEANSHRNRGWEQFTDMIIETVNREIDNVVFILWGTPAQKKAKMIDDKRHCIITSVHPSPLSAYRGFFGSKPFSKANDYLIKNNRGKINWDSINS